jgi:hypothetical protein
VKPAALPAPRPSRAIKPVMAKTPAEPKRKARRRLDIGAIITRALTAAGLMR